MLTDAKIKNLKPKNKRYKILDGKGLYIVVYPSGRKIFSRRETQMKNGKRRDTERVIGEYPEISLAQARASVPNAFSSRPLLFEELCTEWFDRWKDEKRESTIKNNEWAVKKYIIPLFGNTPVKEVRPQIVLKTLEKMPVAVADMCLGIVGQILKLGVATERAESDFTPSLRPYLSKTIRQHHYTPTGNDEIKEVMTAIYRRKWSVTKNAILFQIFTLTRISETTNAQWNEINGDIWTIPKERMKMNKTHVIPLSRQAIKILDEMRGISPVWIFPSNNTHITKFSAEEYIRIVRKKLDGNLKKLVTHSFRSMASTLLHEHGFDHALIEMSLAHQPKDIVSASYNHALLLEKRRGLLQWYADYLENLL